MRQTRIIMGSSEMKQVTVLFMEEDAAFAAVQAGQADLCIHSSFYADLTVDGYDLFSV